MKDKLIIFIVGLLTGAIISTGSIYFYAKANTNNQNEINEKRGEIPNEFRGQNENQMPPQNQVKE